MVSNKSKKKLLIRKVTLVFFLLSSITLFSQSKTERQVPIAQNSIDNFILGIKSNNLGVKKCCIYFAGKYRINEAVQTLINEFDKTSVSEYESFIVWSLCRIGDERCIKKLNEILTSHPHKELKLFCSTMLRIKEYEAALEEPHF